MSCDNCGYTNPPAMLFCGRCGTRLGDGSSALPVALASPATPAPDDQDVAATPRPELAHAERRVVTVLFADLSGFTQLAERLDPEETTAVLYEILGELQAAVGDRQRYARRL